MKQQAYLLDTCALIFLLNGDDRLPKDVREDIEYCQNSYYFSIESLKELVHLTAIGKISLATFNISKIVKHLYNGLNMNDMPVTEKTFLTMESLPVLTINGKRHSDMSDRFIISEAITNKFVLISSDRKFSEYEKYGLNLLQLD